MEEPVLAGDLRHLEWVLEDLGPVLDNLDIGFELGELPTTADSIGKHPDEVAEVASELHQMEALDVIEGSHGVFGKRLKISHATFELGAMVIAREAHEETGSEVRHNLVDGWHL